MNAAARDWWAIVLYCSCVVIFGAIPRSRHLGISMGVVGILILLLNGKAITRLQGAVATYTGGTS